MNEHNARNAGNGPILMRSDMTDQKRFTLVELLLIIAIIGIMV